MSATQSSTPPASVERHAQSLLALVDDDRRRKCEAILDDARRSAAAVLRRAHGDARSRMREAFDEERRRRDARIGAAEANLQTRRRLADQERRSALLVVGWTRIAELLLARWRDADGRREWAASVLDAARKSLRRTAWRIVHAPDWPIAECDALVDDIGRQCGVGCIRVADSTVRAGLSIADGGNVVDGTLDGLIADRAEIESRLLRLIDDEESAKAARAEAEQP